MAARKIHDLGETSSKLAIWSYPSRYSPGALRLIRVEPLLPQKGARIVLDEFPGLDIDVDASRPSYAAISHIWEASPAVSSSKNTRPLYIKLPNTETHVLSWRGLMEAAMAAKYLKCDYLWLDFICLDQESKHDKKLQIKNMANIYAYCSAAIIMLGGMIRAQSIGDESFWHTRAWTLQEAVEAVGRGRGRSSKRYLLIEWPYPEDKNHLYAPKLVGKELAILELWHLLEHGGEPMYIPGRLGTDKYRPVTNRAFGTAESIMSSLCSLMYVPENDPEAERNTAIWRSLWVRTSSREHDLLYSSMNLFTPPIPLEVDYSREFQGLLIQFLETVHKKMSVPYWFQISHKIPVYEWSGLLPTRPDFTVHSVPTYTVESSKTIAAHELLCGSCCSIDLSVEIRGASKETGHTLCAKFLKVVRVAKTETLANYEGIRWQNVRKLLVSYKPGRDTGGRENWTFKTDRNAAIHEVGAYFQSNADGEVKNSYDVHFSDGVPVLGNEEESWNRSHTEGADLGPIHHPSLESGSVALTTLCWFDGRIGPNAAIIGYFNRHFQHPTVYFFDRTAAGNVQRVGTGKLLVKQEDRFKSDIPWRHLRVGGSSYGTSPFFYDCDCDSKEEVPKIELVVKRNPWSRTIPYDGYS